MVHKNLFVENYSYHQELLVMNDYDFVVMKVMVVVEYKNCYPKNQIR
jgi:hypothetical protein